MQDNINVLSRCAGQLFRVNRAKASIGFMVVDNAVSFSCDPNTQVEHLKEDLSHDFIQELNGLQRMLTNVEFTSREEVFIGSKDDNPYGISISGKAIQNLRIVPVCDPLMVYALVVLVNIDQTSLNTNRINVKPFVIATANLFSIKQIRNFLPEQRANLKKIRPEGTLDQVLNNIYHPVIFFNQALQIISYNKHSMNMVHQSSMIDSNSLRELLEYFAPKTTRQVITAVENYTFNGKLNVSEWKNIPFKLNSFQSIQVDLRLIALIDRQAMQLSQTDKLSARFALMINVNKRNELHSLQRFQALTSLIPLGILQITNDFKCIYANDTWSKLTSLTMTTSLGDGWAKCFDSRDLHRILPEMERLNLQNREYSEEIKLNSLSGGVKWVSLKSVGLFDDMGKLDGFIITLDDVTQIYAQKQALENLANTDSLTGISNRSSFHDRLKVAISRVDRHDNAAVFFLDLDKFKAINDTYGHNAGDVVIQQVAQRLHQMVRGEDTIARLGGDEFAIIVSDVRSDSDLVNLAIKLIIEIAKPMTVEKNTLKVQCSIGIAPIKNSRSTIKTVLKHADLAVYKAKSLGRNQFCMYTESLERETLLANYLRASLQKSTVEGFYIEYQPQVNSETNQIVGVEALARWHHPQNQEVKPQEFILQLETHGLINDFFVWQLQDLLPTAKRWIDSGLITPKCRLALNLSAVQLHIQTFGKQLLNTFKQKGIAPNCFSLEVTETAFMEDPISAGDNLKVLRDAGFHITLDDFGTGFSSLSLLRQMPLDSVKIDKDFIADILNNATDAKIVQSMISLSHELDLEVVAEGVESDAVKQWLDANKCPVQQGFHFFRPMPPMELESCLKETRPLH